MGGDGGVLIVDDHRLLAQAVAAALGDRGIPADVAEGPLHPDALAAVAPGTVVVLDLVLGAWGDGGALVAPLCAQGARVVVVTGSADVVAMADALRDGALAVLDKAQPFEDLVDAVVAVRDGASVDDQARRQSILRAADERRATEQAASRVLGRLTPRETEVLDHLCRGRSADEIARLDHVALTTVRAQIRAVFAKLGVRTQLQAVARAHYLRRRAGLYRRRPATSSGTRPDPVRQS